MTEVETSYEQYKETTTNEILDLKERLTQAQESAEQASVIQEKLNEELLAKSALHEEAAKLKIQHKRELENLQEELTQAQSQVVAKD